MTTNDELVRLRKAFAVSVGPAPEPEACPPSDRIWLAVRGELPPDEFREIVDHVATCHACAEDWRIAMAFEEESRAGIVVAPPATRSRSVVARFRPWLAAAAVILVSVVGLQLQGPKPTDPKPTDPKPSFRSAQGEGTTVGAILPKDAPRLRRQFVLPWKPVPGATSYNIKVSTSTLTPLFEADVTSTRLQVPESALANLRSGDRVLWIVTPVFPDGSRPQGTTFQSILVDD